MSRDRRRYRLPRPLPAHLATAWLALVLLAAGHAPAAPDERASGARADGTLHLLVRFHAGLQTAAPGAVRLGGPEERLVRELDGEVRHRFPSVGALAVEVPASSLSALRSDPTVALVEEDPIRYPTFLEPRGLAEDAAALGSGELEPAPDNGLYGLLLTRSLAAQELSTGAGIAVCAADTGLDAGHPDVAPAYRGGIDLIDHDDDPDVGAAGGEGFHGTFVDGILVAAVNGLGVRGVAPQAELYHARVLRPQGGSTSDIMAGVRHLVEERGCRVVNLSLGGTQRSSVEESFYRDLVATHNVLIVAAAGNRGGDSLDFPAGYPAVVGVGAVDSAGNHADFSNRGDDLDLAGPGVLVLSAQPRGTGREALVSAQKRSLTAIPMPLAGKTSPAGLRRRLIDCGTGNTPGEFPRRVRGNLALMQRGDAFFKVKVQNAMNAGAVGAILYNNIDGPLPVPDLVDETAAGGTPWVPAVIVARADGESLRREKKPVVLVNSPSDWGLGSGTSFASPHVAGAATLVWAAAPNLTSAQVLDILLRTAQDLGAPGHDAELGAGLVDAEAAVNAALER